jgi:hypothetical protein
MLDKKCIEEKRRRGEEEKRRREEEKKAEKLEMCQDIWALPSSSQLHLNFFYLPHSQMTKHLFSN